MSSYSDRMKVQLARYKEQRLGVAEWGLWRGNGRSYPHIIPERLYQLNILESIRKEFWEYQEAQQNNLGLHTDFHHLNSSQAFAFNLFFPWLGMGVDPSPLLTAMGLPVVRIAAWSFEHMPDEAERTSVDLCLVLETGQRVLIEVKLTEAHFGQCVPKESHRAKLRNTYMPRLTDLAVPDGLAEATFFLNYQLFRNVSHLKVVRGDVLILLLSRANTFTWQEGLDFKAKYLTERANEAVRLVAIEDVFAQVLSSSAVLPARMLATMQHLSEKYLLPEQRAEAAHS